MASSAVSQKNVAESQDGTWSLCEPVLTFEQMTSRSLCIGTVAHLGLMDQWASQ